MHNIVYSAQKVLPDLPLRDLFFAVGWSDGTETPEMLQVFARPFRNSTFVFSAWDEGKLIGCVRVLSDRMFRAVIYDLAVHPDYQHRGIGKELLHRCVAQCPDAEWLIQTEPHIAGFYEKQGFDRMKEDVFLHIPSKWF